MRKKLMMTIMAITTTMALANPVVTRMAESSVTVDKVDHTFVLNRIAMKNGVVGYRMQNEFFEMSKTYGSMNHVEGEFKAMKKSFEDLGFEVAVKDTEGLNKTILMTSDNSDYVVSMEKKHYNEFVESELTYVCVDNDSWTDYMSDVFVTIDQLKSAGY